jgi:hypothetical protein
MVESPTHAVRPQRAAIKSPLAVLLMKSPFRLGIQATKFGGTVAFIMPAGRCKYAVKGKNKG